jgi:hypothetical protein
LLERIGLRFDFIKRASKNIFFDLFSIPDLFPNLKQIELLNVTYTFANKFELSQYLQNLQNSKPEVPILK